MILRYNRSKHPDMRSLFSAFGDIAATTSYCSMTGKELSNNHLVKGKKNQRVFQNKTMNH